MIRTPYLVNPTFSRFSLTLLAAAGLALAQSPAPPTPQAPSSPNGTWRRAGDPPPAPAQSQPPDSSQPTDAYGQPVTGQPQDAPPPPQLQQDAPPAMNPQNAPPPQATRPPYGLPPEVTLQAGTYITARINQPLSSDHNLVGDSFTATLVQPVVVNGIVVAQRGQLVYGRVTEVQKHHSDKPSRLGLELTGLTLADGTQLPLKSQLVNRQGPTTPGGVQAGTVVGTTAVGAAIGGAVGWGTGAAIGAGAGAVVGIAGVLLTRNHPTIIYPESVLMFQVSTPATITTASQAFHYVGPNEYGPGAPGVQMQMRPRPPVPGYGSSYAPYAPYGPYAPYPYYSYPYPAYYPYYPYWGGVGVWFGGPRFYGGRRW